MRRALPGPAIGPVLGLALGPAIGLAIACGACGAAEAMQGPLPAAPAPATAAPVFELGLHPGETMAFELRVAGVLAGEAQLAVGEPGTIADGRRAIVVRSRAATAGAAALLKKVTDTATTTIDAGTGRPITLVTEFEYGQRKSNASARFTGATTEVTYQRADEPAPHTMTITSEAGLFDAHSAMAQLRGWRAAPGALRTVHVVGGRRLWRVDVAAAGGDTVSAMGSSRRAVVFDGTAYRVKRDLSMETGKALRKFRVWLSDDADRVPLKVVATVEIGDVEMTLTEYARP